MAHYAFLNSDNIVTEVIVGLDENDLVENLNPEDFYANFKGQACKRTSYNTFAGQHKQGKTPFRKNYAGIGFKYDEELDAFIPPKPFESWILNEETARWEAPIPYPQDNLIYSWNEEMGDWEAQVIE